MNSHDQKSSSSQNTQVWDINDSQAVAKCPFMGGSASRTAGHGTTNDDWWPNRLKLGILRQHTVKSDPMDPDFNYKEAFLKLDLEVVKADLTQLMTDSQEWWPADYGHYGGLFIRLSWHAAGTYRIGDGRGGASTGNQRFAPINSWPDNGNLDKARFLLWPIKKKYGKNLSWADLFVLVGNVALESMGFKTAGFAGGREDIWEPEQDIYWGSETEWLANDKRYESGALEAPLGAAHMGLIYVNPEGPNGVPDPAGSAHDIRETFGRMAMNDWETVALVAGGHTFGKAHGAANPDDYVGIEPEGASIENMGKGWNNSYGTGHGDDTITSGVEGAWTPNPTQWDHDYFRVLMDYDWELTKSPAGAHQWRPTDASNPDKAPMAGDAGKKQDLVMTTADIALKIDPEYLKISKHYYENPLEFEEAFAKAWYKLTHRDMGPLSRYLGSDVPIETELWQDPLPEVKHETIDEHDVDALKTHILNSGLTAREMVKVAWASASTYRDSDKRGGANGARIRLSPQNRWEVNEPNVLHHVLDKLSVIQEHFNEYHDAKQVSMADLIILAGSAGIKKALEDGGSDLEVVFTAGRVDALQEHTDVDSFGYLEPQADGFRNYRKDQLKTADENMLIDRANLLTLTVPEMTALVGGLRMLGINHDNTDYGVFTDRAGTLSNDFFNIVTDLNITWKSKSSSELLFEGQHRIDHSKTYTGTRADLIFGSNSELRAISEVFASNDGNERFLKTFVQAWTKVMNLDRFDIK